MLTNGPPAADARKVEPLPAELDRAFAALVALGESLQNARRPEDVVARAAVGFVDLLGCDRCRTLRLAGDLLAELVEGAPRPELLEAEVAAAAGALQTGAARFVSQSSSA